MLRSEIENRLTILRNRLSTVQAGGGSQTFVARAADGTETSAVETTETLSAEIARLEGDLARHDAIQAGFDAGRGVGGDGFQSMNRVDPWDDRTGVRDRALALLGRSDRPGSGGEHLGDGQRARVEGLLRRDDENVQGDYIARRMLITETEHYRSAFARVVCDPRPVLTHDEIRALRALEDLERAMSIGVDVAGGFGVPVLIDPTVVLSAQGSANPFWQIARVEPVTTDAWRGITSDGVSWSWDAEGSQVSDDTPTLAQPVVAVHMARGFVPYSIEVGMDYPNLARELARLHTEGYDELVAEAFAVGSGSGQPFGLFTALDSNTNVEISVETSGSLGRVDISSAWSALPDRWKGNATWLMSYSVAEELSAFGEALSADFTVDLTGMLRTVRQRPVRYSSYAPDAADVSGTTGAGNWLAVGDFGQFLVAQRIGMNIEPIQTLFHASNGRPSGQRGAFAWARVGSDAIVEDAFRLITNT